MHLAIGRITLCISETTLVEGTRASLATFYVFMYEYLPGLVLFFALTKMHFTGTRLQKAAIFHHTLKVVNSLHDIKVGTHEGTGPCDCVVSENP